MNKITVGIPRQILACDVEGVMARIDAIESPYSRCHFLGPATGSTAEVGTNALRIDLRPGKNGKIAVEKLLSFLLTEVRLIVSLPLIAKTLHSLDFFRCG